jgi:hypothetical protein
MEVAIQYLKKQIQECLESDMSPMTKSHIVSEYTKAIHVLEYERYNFVPRQTSADHLNQLEVWKEQWNSGQYKFVPELLGLTKAIILDKAFSETPIKQPVSEEQEIITIVHSENKEPLIQSDIEQEVIEEVRVEGRVVEEVRVEGRAIEPTGKRKSLFSWFKK